MGCWQNMHKTHIGPRMLGKFCRVYENPSRTSNTRSAIWQYVVLAPACWLFHSFDNTVSFVTYRRWIMNVQICYYVVQFICVPVGVICVYLDDINKQMNDIYCKLRCNHIISYQLNNGWFRNTFRCLIVLLSSYKLKDVQTALLP